MQGFNEQREGPKVLFRSVVAMIALVSASCSGSADPELETGTDTADVATEPDVDASDVTDESDTSLPDSGTVHDADAVDETDSDTPDTDTTDIPDGTDADDEDVDELHCEPGYEHDGTECVNIDECDLELDECDPLVDCADTDGGYTCGACPLGYDDVHEDGTECVNIDECDLELDECDPLVDCTDTDGSYTCGACPLGYDDVHEDGTECRSRFDEPPVDVPQCYLWGTSHFRSLDGLVYDLQGAGEWRLTFVDEASRFEVQARQEPYADGYAASTTGVVVAVGDNVVEIEGRTASPLVDGAPVAIPEEGLALDRASLHDVDGVWVVAWDNGAQVRVHRIADRLDVEIYIAVEHEGATRGLCADSDGRAAHDVLPPDGDFLLPPVDIQELYTLFVHAWRVDTETSLFTYGDGTGPETYFDATYPVFYTEASDLEVEERALYEPGCLEAELGHPFLVEACILDAYLEDMSVAISGAQRVRDPELILALDKPLLFAGWTQEAPLANGTWTVADDYRSLLQSVNGDPTLFVSPNAYLNVLIEGTIRVGSNWDDDIVGFVFGHRAPVRANGDSDYLFDTYLFDWKQADQTYNGLFSAAGYTLVRVNGDFSVSWNPFWRRVDDTDGWTVIATNYASNSGWVDGVENSFQLLHTPHRVDIWMNGELIFREAGEFQSGRFGFYNNSQQDVRYADFRVIDIDAEALCGDGVLDPEETCDDGNRDDGDGCDSSCVLE